MNRNQFQSPGSPDDKSRQQPRAPLCSHDHGLHRSELVLFLLLVGAVGLAFSSHTQVLNRFVARLPEFASIVADLFRAVV